MVLRMFIHSAVFAVVLSVGAVALNGAGVLDGQKPGHGYSDSHKWRGHHDD